MLRLLDRLAESDRGKRTSLQRNEKGELRVEFFRTLALLNSILHFKVILYLCGSCSRPKHFILCLVYETFFERLRQFTVVYAMMSKNRYKVYRILST